MQYFRGSLLVTVAGLIAGAALGWKLTGTVQGMLMTLFLVFVLGVLEVSLSFDNAVVNATVLEDNIKAWSGDHCIDPVLVPGVLFSNLRLTRSDPSIMDVAPTVLELFGIAPPAHMDGRGLIDVAGLAGARQGKKS